MPRSGSGITSSAATSASSMIRAVVRRSCNWRERSTANPASATINSSLPNSEDWKLNPGNGIQRRAPAIGANPYTTRSSPIITAYSPSLYSRSRE